MNAGSRSKEDAARTAPFKRCPTCGFAWTTRRQFLEDPELTLIGYQVNFKKLAAGLILFNHGCKGATLAIEALAFRDLYRGPVFRERLTGGATCPGHCLHESDLVPCPEACECSYVREIINIVRKWPKKRTSSAEKAAL
ncbi:MAG: hypothetical protein P8X55_18675 [Desulfosarcinaceae bacterium]